MQWWPLVLSIRLKLELFSPQEAIKWYILLVGVAETHYYLLSDAMPAPGRPPAP